MKMSTHLPFLSCWENPKPFYFPSLNIPFERWLLLRFAFRYIQHRIFVFAKATREIFAEVLYCKSYNGIINKPLWLEV